MSSTFGDGSLLNNVVGSPNLYTGEVYYSAFDYRLSTPVCAVFTALFGLSLLIHVGQAIRSRFWFLLYTLVAAALVETIGWAFRLWGALAFAWLPEYGGMWDYPRAAFLGQITTLIIAPAFSTAALYIILGVLVSRLGEQYCRLPARTYTAIFVTGDILSLVIQAAGGGYASSADTTAGANDGAKIMVAGILVQMVVMIAYTLILLEFSTRYFLDRPLPNGPWHPFACCGRRRRNAAIHSSSASEMTQVEQIQSMRVLRGTKDERKARWMMGALLGSTTLIFVRSVFRTVELLDGWSGKLATDQVLFTVLDGGMIVLSSFLLNILHPMFLLRSPGSGTAQPGSEAMKEFARSSTPPEERR